MTDYELKRLGKSQLIQMLTDQGKEIERLENELRELQSKLLERRIHIEESGSIAEASLRLSGIFEDAQRAADEYLTNIRIEKAKELLGNSDYSMKEICVMVGYSDPTYFSRSFKKNVGVTPTEYKELETR